MWSFVLKSKGSGYWSADIVRSILQVFKHPMLVKSEKEKQNGELMSSICSPFYRDNSIKHPRGEN